MSRRKGPQQQPSSDGRSEQQRQQLSAAHPSPTPSTSLSTSSAEPKQKRPKTGGQQQRKNKNNNNGPRPASSTPNASSSNGHAHGHGQQRHAQQPSSSESEISGRFDDLVTDNLVSADIVRGIKHEVMTDVQRMTLPTCLTGMDVLAQAKTGTGKTLAFLVPTLQRILLNPRASLTDFATLIIAPTRDLAKQIADEAVQVIAHLPPQNFKVETVIGGGNKKPEQDMKGITTKNPNIIIGTPGRLVDLLENHPEFVFRMAPITTFILDEADRLLDQGFLPDIKKIVSYLPPSANTNRQSLLFSATIDNRVRTVAGFTLRPDHAFISTLSPTDSLTVDKIHQEYTILPSTQMFPFLHHLLKTQLRSSPTSKLIVFLPTARLAQLSAALFTNTAISSMTTILEIHSRLSQPARNRSITSFKTSSSAILFASDVVARGMDFPAVDGVIQLGMPSSVEQYVHRVGRTGRAEQSGTAVLVLSEIEGPWMHVKGVEGLDVREYNGRGAGEADVRAVEEGMRGVGGDVKGMAYSSWLGYYKSSLKILHLTPTHLVQHANAFALDVLLCPAVPALNKVTVGKMGLKGVPGLVIEAGGEERGGRG
ncbi:hypothetical protein HK104_003606, partial [Borealophlyctis nickersoniae]